MKSILVTVSSDNLLSLQERQKYVATLFTAYATYGTDKVRNQGFLHKFVSSIGFKPVISTVDNQSRYFRPVIKSPEDYKTPLDLLYEGMRTPVQSFEIMEFYFPVQKVSHPDQRFCYHTKDIARKFKSFLAKVFPALKVELKELEKEPPYPLKDFVFETFYRSLEDYTITIECSIPELLPKEDLLYMIPKLQTLTKLPIGIAQYHCEVCKHNTFGKSEYHIEIVYLSFKGEEVIEKRKSEYGDSLIIDENVYQKSS